MLMIDLFDWNNFEEFVRNLIKVTTKLWCDWRMTVLKAYIYQVLFDNQVTSISVNCCTIKYKLVCFTPNDRYRRTVEIFIFRHKICLLHELNCVYHLIVIVNIFINIEKYEVKSLYKLLIQIQWLKSLFHKFNAGIMALLPCFKVVCTSWTSH